MITPMLSRDFRMIIARCLRLPQEGLIDLELNLDRGSHVTVVCKFILPKEIPTERLKDMFPESFDGDSGDGKEPRQ